MWDRVESGPLGGRKASATPELPIRGDVDAGGAKTAEQSRAVQSGWVHGRVGATIASHHRIPSTAAQIEVPCGVVLLLLLESELCLVWRSRRRNG